MKLIADEGVDKPIVDAFRKAGFDVEYILETNRGADDRFILEIANTQKRILVTQDKDFGELVYRLKYAHHGVVLFRLQGYSAEIKAQIVVKMFAKHQKELTKAFTVIQKNVIRIRKDHSLFLFSLLTYSMFFIILLNHSSQYFIFAKL